MRVNTVSASIRYSEPVGDGSFKTVELSAEGAVGPNENWQEAQSELYDHLVNQLREMWIKKALKAIDSKATSTNGVGTGDTSLLGPNTPQTSKIIHYCSKHGVDFRRYEKNGHEWYSHKSENGWCREQ